MDLFCLGSRVSRQLGKIDRHRLTPEIHWALNANIEIQEYHIRKVHHHIYTMGGLRWIRYLLTCYVSVIAKKHRHALLDSTLSICLLTISVSVEKSLNAEKS